MTRRTGNAGPGGSPPPTAATRSNVAKLLADGVQHHRAGRLGQAESRYREVLRSDPEHPDALHLLGQIALQARQPQAAADLIGRAILRNPRSAVYRGTLAGALQALGRLDAAIECCRAALELEPRDA